LIRLEPLEQLVAVRERAAKEHPSMPMPMSVSVVMAVVHCHLLSS
jgi:hypothetical protein